MYLKRVIAPKDKLTFIVLCVVIISCDLLNISNKEDPNLSVGCGTYNSISIVNVYDFNDQFQLLDDWYLEAYMDIINCSIDKFPDDAAYSTVRLVFNNNGTITGSTPSNIIGGEFFVDGNMINISLGGTKINEPEWGRRFWDAINNTTHWGIEDSLLFLFSSEILIFNKNAIGEKALIKEKLIGEWKELYQSPPTKLIISDNDTIYQLVEQLPFVPGEFDTFRMYYDITAIDSMLTVRNFYDSWFAHDLPITRKHQFWFLGSDLLNIDQFGFGDLEDRLTTFYLIREINSD